MERQYDFIKLIPSTTDILASPKLIYQRKWDGAASEVFIEEPGIAIIGRGLMKGRQSDFTEAFPELIHALKALNIPKQTRFLAEVIVLNPKTGKDEVGLATGRTGRKEHIDLYSREYPACLIIHDAICVSGEDVRNKGYVTRMEQLKSSIPSWKSNNVFFIANKTDGKAEWVLVEQNSLEGVVARDPNAPFNTGVYKIKREITEDVYCRGEYTPSESKTGLNMEYWAGNQLKKGVFANLICYQLNQAGQEINVCDVGSGFTNADQQRIQGMLDMGEITKENPLIMEIKANGREVSLKFRHPRIKRFRTDKRWQECVIQELQKMQLNT